MAQKEADLGKIIQTLRNHTGEKLSIEDISKESGLSWHRVYRILTDLILSKVANQYFEVAEDMGIVPQLTTDGLVFRPQPAKEVA